MKEHQETCDWLKSKSFNDKDIFHIKKLYEKEGVKFCIKTFNAISIEEMKEDLKKYKNKSSFRKCKKVFVNLKISVSQICR